MRNSVIYLIVFASLAACVPARQMEEMTSKKELLESENQTLKASNQDLESRLAEMTTNFDMYKEKHDLLVRDTTEFGIRFRQIKSQYDKLNELNDMLASKNTSMIQDAAAENQRLLDELEKTRLELQQKEDALDKKEGNLSQLENNLSLLTEELQEREQRLSEMQELLARQESASNALKDKIAKALLGFKDKGLTVDQRNGKVYVGMEANLLFPSGSTVINQEGKKAIIDLALALEDQADLEIIVEGHTDTDKLASASIPRDNWELSVLRSTAVVKIMTENSKVDPKILSAAGRSEYIPVDPEDKSKNRRIEVIISPNLDELYQVIDQK